MKPSKISIALLAVATVMMSGAPALAVFPYTTSLLSVVMGRGESKKITTLEIVSIILEVVALALIIIFANKMLVGWGLK